MQKGLLPLDIGVYFKMLKPFWIFKYNEHIQVFDKWIIEK